MMRLLRIAACILAVSSSHAAEPEGGEEKAVRMKTTRQLKEILDDLHIKFPKDADKEKLRKIALKHGAITAHEKKHPEKKKAPRGSQAQTVGGMADMLFPMSVMGLERSTICPSVLSSLLMLTGSFVVGLLLPQGLTKTRTGAYQRRSWKA